MSCAHKTCSAPPAIQPRASAWLGRPIFIKALVAIAEILQEASDLSRICSRMAQRRHQRQALRELDDRLLDDIGVTPEQAEREVRKWFWQ
jgi:uncharacterized protein YjiS (DUF1127 family)